MNEQLELESALGDCRQTASLGRASAELLPSVVIGQFVAAEPERGPVVDFAMNCTGTPIVARTLVPLDLDQLGSDVALMFEDAELTRPIIVGVVQEWNAPVQHRLIAKEPAVAVEVKHDEDSLLLTAAREITLQCGKSSITLTSAGKLLLRGAYLLSRSSGVNRIKGGSVQIN